MKVKSSPAIIVLQGQSPNQMGQAGEQTKDNTRTHKMYISTRELARKMIHVFNTVLK